MIARLVRVRPWALMAVSYTIVSIVILWPVLTAGPLHHTVLIEADASFPVWANGWVAFALTHLRDPFFSPTVFAPRGVNLLSNTTSVGLAVLFTPVTWLIGPIGAFNIQLILLPVVSALAMCLAVRPWVTSTTAVWIAGLAWGFCPLALESLTWGWTNFLYLATAPLLFWLVCDLVHFKRHSPRFLGLSLSAVITIQFLIGVEMLSMIAVVSIMVLTVATVVVLIVNRPYVGALLGRVARTAAWSLPILIVILFPLVLFALKGPAPLPTWIVGRGFLQFAGGHPYLLVKDPTSSGAFLANVSIIYPSVYYFGYALLAAVSLVVLVRIREALTWVLAAFAIVSIWLSMGKNGFLHPWRIGLRLPVLHNIIVSRFIDLAWFPVIVLVALGIDRIVTTLRPRLGAKQVLPIAMIFPVVAFSQLGYTLHASVRITPWSIVPDPALVTLSHATPHALFVTFPTPLAARGMIQQTSDQFAYELVGGWGPAVRQGTASAVATYNFLADETELGGPQLTSAQLDLVGAQVENWGVADVISPKFLTYPDVRGYTLPAAFIGTMTELFGTPETVDGEWVWPVGHHPWMHTPTSRRQWDHCVFTVFNAHPDALPACVVTAVSHPAAT